MKETSQDLRTRCDRCGKEWIYKGSFRSPIRCPGRLPDGRPCKSSRNEANRKKFGRFNPERKSRGD